MYTHIGRILQDNYPEIVKRSFIVNGNYLIIDFFSIVTPVIKHISFGINK